MNWYGLYGKIGKQSISKLRKTEVKLVEFGRELPLLLKFDDKGNPYFIIKE